MFGNVKSGAKCRFKVNGIGKDNICYKRQKLVVGEMGEPKQQLNLKCCPQDECFLLLIEK